MTYLLEFRYPFSTEQDATLFQGATATVNRDYSLHPSDLMVNVTLPRAAMSPIIRNDKRLTLTGSVDNRPVRLKNRESLWPISSKKLTLDQSNSRIES